MLIGKIPAQESQPEQTDANAIQTIHSCASLVTVQRQNLKVRVQCTERCHFGTKGKLHIMTSAHKHYDVISSSRRMHQNTAET